MFATPVMPEWFALYMMGLGGEIVYIPAYTVDGKRRLQDDVTEWAESLRPRGGKWPLSHLTPDEAWRCFWIWRRTFG